MALYNPIKNSLWNVRSGFGVTNTSGAAQTVTPGYIVARTPVSGSITAATSTSSELKYTTSAAHGLSVGNLVQIAGVTPVAYSGTLLVASVPTTTTFTVASAANPGDGTVATATGAAVTAASTSVSANGNYITYTTADHGGLTVGQNVVINGVTGAYAAINNVVTTIVAVPSTTTLVVASNVLASAAGTTITLAGSPVLNIPGYFTTGDTNKPGTDVKLPVGSATVTLTTAGSPVNTSYSSTLSSTLTQRLDVLALDTSAYVSGTTNYTVLSGPAVSATSTPALPQVADKYIAFAVVPVSYNGSILITGTPVDIRNIDDYLPLRAFNRSQAVRIGGQKVNTGADAQIPLDTASSYKEFSYHSAIGAVYTSGSITSYPGDYAVHSGGVVTLSGTAKQPSITSGDIVNRITDTYIPFVNSTVTLPLPSGASQTVVPALGASSGSTTRSVYIVWVDKTTGVIGTSSQKASPSILTGAQIIPPVPADKVPLALVTLSNTDITEIKDIRPRQ